MKIFIGNVDDRTTQDELSALFEKYGTVVSCAVKKQYAFVHMRVVDSAMKAIEALNGRELHGKRMVVELSKPRPQNTWKIFVGNVSSACDVSELRKMFQVYGRVVECDVVKDYAFVHMERESDAREAIENLNGKELKGKRINVELSYKIQNPLESDDGSHSTRSRRSHDLRDPSQSRAEAYDRRRATEAAYASYALRSPYERYAESARYNSYENRPPSPLYYSRDRSPMRRSPTRSSYSAADASAVLASKYRSQIALAAAYSGQSSAALASSYGSQSSSLAPGYGNQATAYGADIAASYSNQASSYGSQVPTMPNYGTQASSLASSYGSQPSSMPYTAQLSSASPYASSSAMANTYRQQPCSAYESPQFPGLGQQSAYSTLSSVTADTPTYERTRLSPPRSALSDRYTSDRRFSELSDYRRLTEPQVAYRRSPPKMDYRQSLESDYSQYSSLDYLRAAPLHSNYQRRL
ncbi:uncharacterized protein RCH25_050119 isoform 2-T2 [Pelodytes ibericus]